MQLWQRLRILLLPLAAALVVTVPAWADGFKVLSAQSREVAGVYRLDARIEYALSEPALEALFNGVPLTIQLEMEILKQRDWLWDETVASLTQRYRLEYHALARQYLVTNLNSGEFRSFPTRAAAMDYMGRIEEFPLIDASLLDPAGSYYGQLRASLDIESLPAPLRPVAYLSSEWRLASPWYLWSL